VALALQLDEWKKMAQEIGEPLVTPWVFNEAALQMQPNGAGYGLPWMLKTPGITLSVSQGKWNGVAAVRLSSQYLWPCTKNAILWPDLRLPSRYLPMASVFWLLVRSGSGRRRPLHSFSQLGIPLPIQHAPSGKANGFGRTDQDGPLFRPRQAGIQ